MYSKLVSLYHVFYIILDAVSSLKYQQPLFFCPVQCHPVFVFAGRAAQPAGKAGLHAEPRGKHRDGDTRPRGRGGHHSG